jgi:LysR family transcriptional regulator, glycine cleavage system transcriptional activator
MKLPPLNALRAFDAVARHVSVKDAAAELFVTPAAVSQQLKTLEAALGIMLFERHPRELRLTELGRTYHRSIGRALRLIADATERLLPDSRGTAISVITSFAALWLAPRLADFAQRYPSIEVRIEADPVVVDLVSGGFDLAIRMGAGVYREAECHELFAQNLVPLAAPEYKRLLTKKGNFDWSKSRLLHESGVEYWDAWLEQRNVTADTSRGLFFSHGMLAYAAAQAGEGVALAPIQLVAKLVGDRRLVVVDRMLFHTGLSYWLAWPKPRLRTLPEPARLFRDWIIEQSRTVQSELEQSEIARSKK